MKRIAGTLVLLAGLSGCISITTVPAGGQKKTNETPPATPGAVSPTMAMAQPSPVLPMAQPSPAMAMAQPMPAMAPPPAVPNHPTWNPPAAHKVAMTPAMAGHPSNYSPLPTPMPTASQIPATAPVMPTAHAGMTPPNPLPELPPGMPMAVTPRNEPPVTRPVNFATTTAPAQEPLLPAVHRTEPESLPRLDPNLTPPPTATAKSTPAEESKPSKPGAPLMRMVNTRRITLNFEVKDVGPSGLSSVELWYTQDCREWKKYEAPTQAQAYVIEVDEEGMYGFTLLAKSGLGLSKEPPQPGEQPQVWVFVDLTRPTVQLSEIQPTRGRQSQISIAWKATDRNLGRQPITLSYAEKPDGPWTVIATQQENTGKYVWQPPQGISRAFFKVEASDLAGNVGQAVSSRPVLLDSSTPSVSITNVDAVPGQ